MPNIRFEYSGKLSDGRFWDETSNKRVTVELDDNDLTVPEMLEEFMNFMQAIGYKFEIGDRFDVVNDFKFDSKQDNLDFDSNGISHTDFGTSVPGFGAVPPDTAS
jgi:hypothetical protein